MRCTKRSQVLSLLRIEGKIKLQTSLIHSGSGK